MLRVAIRRIKPGKEQKLRNWLAELNLRASEVRATFKDETVRAEQAYIISSADGPLLIYIMEAQDFCVAQKAFLNSQHQIDHEHRQVIEECLGESLNVAPLYDMKI